MEERVVDVALEKAKELLSLISGFWPGKTERTRSQQPDDMAAISDADICAFLQGVSRTLVDCHLVLDVGAGTGVSSLPYLRAGLSVVSVDIRPEALRQGIKDGKVGAGWAVVADGRRLPFPEHTFDIVSSRWFLHEFRDKDDFLREMRRVAKKQGKIVALDFLAPSQRARTFLNRFIFPDECVLAGDDFLAPWSRANLVVEDIQWHAKQLEEDTLDLEELLVLERETPEEVKNELCMEQREGVLFVTVPIAFIVARRMEANTLLG